MPRRGNSKRQATVRKIQDPDDNCGSKKRTRPPKKVNNQSSDGIVKLKDAEIDPATDKSKKNRKRKMVEVEVSKQAKTAKKSNLPCETNATQQDQPNYAMIDISKLAIIIGACYVKWKLYMEKEGKTTDEQFAEFLLSIYEQHMSVCVKERRTNTIETEDEPLHGENCIRLPIEETVNKKDISTQTQEEPQDEECTWSRHIIKEDTSEIEQQDSQAECYSEDATKTEIAPEIQPQTVKDVHQCSGSLVHNIATKECSKVRDLTETVCATKTIGKQDDLLNSNENANAQNLATQVNSETGNMELEPDLMHFTPREVPICSIESVKSLSSSVCQQIGKVDSDRYVDSAVDDDHEIPGTDAEIDTSTAIQIEPKTMENDVNSSDAKRTTPCCMKNRNIKENIETVLFKPASATKTTAVDQNVSNPTKLTNPMNGPVLTSITVANRSALLRPQILNSTILVTKLVLLLAKYG